MGFFFATSPTMGLFASKKKVDLITCGLDNSGKSTPEPRRSYQVGRLVKAVWNAAPQRVMAP